MHIKSNPPLYIIGSTPLFTTEEAWQVFTATGVTPQPFPLEDMAALINKATNPISSINNRFFGRVCLWEYGQPLPDNTTTQDLVKALDKDIVYYRVFSRDPEIVKNNPDILAVDDIRALIGFAQSLLGQNHEPVTSTTFLKYLEAQNYIARQALDYFTANTGDIAQAATQLFHEPNDYRLKNLFPQGVTLDKDFDGDRDVFCAFSYAEDRAAEGYLAFTKEQVATLKSEGKNAIFVKKHIDFRDFDLISNISSGLIICDRKDEYDNSFLQHVMGTPTLYLPVTADGAPVRIKNSTLEYGGKHLGFRSRVVLDTAQKRLLIAHATADLTEPYPALSSALIQRSDDMRRAKSDFKILANIANPQDAKKIASLGVDGIGLVRTEYFFTTPQKSACLKKALTTAAPDALAALEKHQQHDFTTMLEALPPCDVTVRLLDPKPEEWMTPQQQDKIAGARGVQIARAIPALYAAQASALFNAASACAFEGRLKILVPYVSTGDDMRTARQIVETNARQTGYNHPYEIGTMLETFNALANIKDITPHADFANIGPKDLTIELLGGLRSHEREAIKDFLHNTYGDDKHYRYSHPYNHLHHEIERRLEEALTHARALKPHFPVTLCGDELHKSNPSLAFARRHLQAISVPCDRASVAITKFKFCYQLL